MLFSNKLASAGLLVLVALTIVTVHAQCNAVEEKELKAIKQHDEHEGGKIIDKRAAGDEGEAAPAKKGKRGKKTTTVAPKGDADAATTAKAAAKKHGKKVVDKALDAIGATSTTGAPTTVKPDGSTTTTTKKPDGSTTTTKKPAGSTTTKKSGCCKKRTRKPAGDDDDEEAASTTASPDAKELESALQSIGKIRQRKKLPKGDPQMMAANEKWLQGQEMLAIEHVLAGVIDWHKVLAQTGYKTYNKVFAGEVFDELNKMTRQMRGESRPNRLIAYYRSKLFPTHAPIADDRVLI